MKKLLFAVVALFFMFAGSLDAKHAPEENVMQFCFPLDAQKDKRSETLQRFLVHHAFLAVDAHDREGCTVSTAHDGKVIIEGPESRVEVFLLAFREAIERVVIDEMTENAFAVSKGCFMQSYKEKGIPDIKWEEAVQAKHYLGPLEHLLKGATPIDSVLSVSAKPNYEAFYSLRLTADDQKHITQLIKNLADWGKLTLFRKQKEMDKLGDKVYAIHPLRFIGYVLADPVLKKKMADVLDDYFKRKGFFNGHGNKEGFAKRMTREAKQNNLLQYLPGFAKSLGVSEHSIKRYFDHHDWEGLVKHLVKH